MMDRKNLISSLIQTAGYKAKVNPNKASEVVVQCPYCSVNRPDKLKLYIDTDKLIFHCFRCGVSGRVIKLFEDLDLDYSVLEDTAYQDAKTNTSAKQQEPAFKLQPWMFETITQYGMKKNLLYDIAIDYLRSRNLTFEDILEFNPYATIITNITNTGIHYVDHITNKYIYYILLPTFDGKYFAARLYDTKLQNKKRYLYLSKVYTDIIIPIFGWFDNANYSVLHLVEGQFDGIKLHKYIPDQHILVLGGKSKLTSYNKLISQYKIVVYWLDQDITGNDLDALSQFEQDMIRSGAQTNFQYRYSTVFKDVGDVASRSDLDTFISCDMMYLRLKVLQNSIMQL